MCHIDQCVGVHCAAVSAPDGGRRNRELKDAVAWWAVRRYEHSYWVASVKKKLKIELKDNAKNE